MPPGIVFSRELSAARSAYVAGFLLLLCAACTPVSAPSAPAARTTSARAPSLPARGAHADAGTASGADAARRVRADAGVAADAGTNAVRATQEAALPGSAKVSWVVVPLDHVECCELAWIPGGGVVALGDNEAVKSHDDMFLIRLDAGGRTVWQKRATGRFVRTLSVGAGRAYLTTLFNGNVHLDQLHLHGPTLDSIFVGAVDLSGTTKWGHVIGMPVRGDVNASAAARDGGLVVAFHGVRPPASGLFTFKPAGGTDALVGKWSSQGKFLWVDSFNWAGDDEVSAVVSAAHNRVVVAGTRCKSPRTSATGATGRCRGWIAQIDPNGKTEWERDLGTPTARLKIYGVRRLPGGRLAVRGWFSGHQKLGGTVLDARKGGSYLAVLDSTAQHVVWARQEPEIACMAVDGAGRILLGSSDGIRVARRAGAEPSLIHFGKDVYEIQSCVAGGTHHLYVGGYADSHAKLGSTSLPRARTIRFRSVPADDRGFVAKLDY